MNRQEAKERFQKDACLPRAQAKKQVEEKIRQSFSQFQAKILQGFSDICECAGKEEIEIAFIQISWLRASMLEGTYFWYIQAQDEEQYLDLTERATVLDMKEFFSPYEELEKELKKSLRRYENTLTDYDVEWYKLQAIEDSRGYLEIALMQVFREIGTYPAYQTLHKAPLFRILFGEYKGPSKIVQITDKQTEKKVLEEEFFREEFVEEDVTEADEKIEQIEGFPNRKADFEKKALTRRDFSWLGIEEKTICMKSLFYSLFTGVPIRKSIFLFCNLIGADFSKACVEDSYFQACILQNSKFEAGIFRRTGFVGCQFGVENEVGEEASVFVSGVSFRNAVFEEVSFAFADISQCDFRGARVQGLILEETKMAGSIWEEKSLIGLTLTPKQREEIILV